MNHAYLATISWQRAWANSELGYTPTDEELSLLQDAARRPDYYQRQGEPPSTKRRAHPTSTYRLERDDRPYRLPLVVR